jgi:hypothetical protein
MNHLNLTHTESSMQSARRSVVATAVLAKKERLFSQVQGTPRGRFRDEKMADYLASSTVQRETGSSESFSEDLVAAVLEDALHVAAKLGIQLQAADALRNTE